MDEWLYEDGIGEARALQLVNGAVAAIRIERQGWPRAGTVIGTARLRKKLGHRALVDIGHDREALLSPIPPGATEGADLTVEITREAMRERGRPKLPLARPSAAPHPPGRTCARGLARKVRCGICAPMGPNRLAIMAGTIFWNRRGKA